MRPYFLLIAASILALGCTDKKEQLQGEWISSYVNFIDSVRYPFETSEILTFNGDSLTWTRTGSSRLLDQSKQNFAFEAEKDLIVADSSSQFALGLNIISPDCFVLLPKHPDTKSLFYRRLRPINSSYVWNPAGKSYSFEVANSKIILNFFESGLLTSSFIKKGEEPTWEKGVWRTMSENNRTLLITEAPFPYTFVLDSISDSGAYFTNYDETPQQLFFKAHVPQLPNQLLGKWKNTQFEKRDLYDLSQSGKHIQYIEITQDSLRIYSPVAPSTNPYSIGGSSNLIVQHLRKDSAQLVERMSIPKNPFQIQRKTNQLWFIQELKENRLVLQFKTEPFDFQHLIFERIP